MTMLLVHQDTIVGIWPLAFSRPPGSEGVTLASNAGPLAPPWIDDRVGGRLRQDLFKQCARVAMAFGRAHPGLPHQEALAMAPWDPGENDPWVREWLQEGATTSNHFELLVDLSMDLEAIRGCFRKSYRPLVNKALRLWQVQVHTGPGSSQALLTFKDLHLTVSGRKTRNDETWACQAEGMEQGQAFLVALRGEDGSMVGGGLFQTSASEGIYAVGVYKRELFDLPLGHLVQMVAIQTLKAAGMRWYRVGQRFYPGDTPPPSAKQLNISYFEEGFATRMLPRVLLRWSPSPALDPGPQE